MHTEIPQLPELFYKGLISRDGAERLLKWKKAFEDLGLYAELEEESRGSVKFSDGKLMEITFDVSLINVDDSPYGIALLSINNKATVRIHNPSGDFNDWMKELEKAGSPITETNIEGTWEEIYNLIVKHLQFREKSIPPFPENMK